MLITIPELNAAIDNMEQRDIQLDAAQQKALLFNFRNLIKGKDRMQAELATAHARIADLIDKLQTESHRLEDEIRKNLQQRERIAALEAEQDAAAADTDKVWVEILDGVYEELRAGATFENVCLSISARRYLRKLNEADAARAGKAGE